MKKMINTLYGVLLIVALAIMPLRGMETEFARAADEAGEAMIKAKEAIDEYIATLPLEQQEEFERQVAKYKDFSKLTIEEQLEYERLAAELFGRSYEVVIVEQ